MKFNEYEALKDLLTYCYKDRKHWYKEGQPKNHIYPIAIKPLEDYYNKQIGRKYF